MFFDHILFLSSLILYTISPNKWHKALPCICLFLKDFRHEIDLAFLFAALGDLFLHDDWSITCGTLAFGIANIIFGTVFLEYNLYYFIDDSRTSAENNKESAKANDSANDSPNDSANDSLSTRPGYELILHPSMLLFWALVCCLLYFIANDHWCLFSGYALTMTYAIYQAFRLRHNRPQVLIFMSLFLLSDLIVLMTFEPQDLDWLFQHLLGQNGQDEISFNLLLPLVGSLGTYAVKPFEIIHCLDLVLYWFAMWGLKWSFP